MMIDVSHAIETNARFACVSHVDRDAGLLNGGLKVFEAS